MFSATPNDDVVIISDMSVWVSSIGLVFQFLVPGTGDRLVESKSELFMEGMHIVSNTDLIILSFPIFRRISMPIYC